MQKASVWKLTCRCITMEIVDNTDPKNVKRIRELEKRSKRRKEIAAAFIELGSKSDVARVYNLSRERIGQIVKGELGARSPIVQSPTWFEWTVLKKVSRAYRLSAIEISRKSGVNSTTVVRVLNGNQRYIQNVWHHRDVAAVKVLIALVSLAKRRINIQEKATRDLISEFQKIKYGYSNE